jgi:hypothetical protein
VTDLLPTPLKEQQQQKYLKVIQKIPEQRTRKTRNQATTEKAILGTAHILRKVLM